MLWELDRRGDLLFAHHGVVKPLKVDAEYFREAVDAHPLLNRYFLLAAFTLVTTVNHLLCTEVMLQTVVDVHLTCKLNGLSGDLYAQVHEVVKSGGLMVALETTDAAHELALE